MRQSSFGTFLLFPKGHFHGRREHAGAVEERRCLARADARGPGGGGDGSADAGGVSAGDANCNRRRGGTPEPRRWAWLSIAVIPKPDCSNVCRKPHPSYLRACQPRERPHRHQAAPQPAPPTRHGTGPLTTERPAHKKSPNTSPGLLEQKIRTRRSEFLIHWCYPLLFEFGSVLLIHHFVIQSLRRLVHDFVF